MALVQAKTTPPSPILRAAGEELVPELRLWRVPADIVPRLRRAGDVGLSRPDRPLKTTVQAQASDPLVPLEWWRSGVGADRVDAPGPGMPVTVVDSGVDMSHPEFAGRPNTTVLNPQTTGGDDEDHGTEVASVLAAPNNGVGIVGVYPDAVLRIWDASPFGILNESAAIQGIVEAARRGPGVINLSFGGEDDNPLLHDAILFAFRSGSIVVAAAGNDGFEGSPKNFPAAYPVGFVNSAVADLQGNRAGGRKAWLAIGPGRRAGDGRFTPLPDRLEQEARPTERHYPARRAEHLPGREPRQRRDGRALAVIGHPEALRSHRRRFMHPLESPSIVRHRAIAAENGRDRRFTIPLQIHTTEFTNPTPERVDPLSGQRLKKLKLVKILTTLTQAPTS